MSLTTILLSTSSTEEMKLHCANEIINNYDLPLVPEQILSAHNKIPFSVPYIKYTCNLKHWCSYLLDPLLISNKNMYIAIIISLNNNLPASNLISIVVFNNGKFKSVGISDILPCTGFETYCKLLDNYDFDVSDLDIDKFTKMKIKKYRDSKYSGKMTKAAKK